MIVLNLKTYAEATGAKGLSLIKAANSVSKKSLSKIIVCPQATQLHYAKEYSTPKLSFFAQHADDAGQGTFTGALTLEAIAAEGCGGTLINHAEKNVSSDHVFHVIEKSKALNLKTIVCANTVQKGVLFSQFKPWGVAIEIPELIATGNSISRVNPGVVELAVRQIKAVDAGILVFVGAGVANAEDYAKSLELGADGVLLSSRFVLAKDPEAWLESLAQVKPTAKPGKKPGKG